MNKIKKILEALGLDDKNYQEIRLKRDEILKIKDFLDLNGCQNNSPTLGELLDKIVPEEGEIFTYEGYIIGTERGDSRLAIDCVCGENIGGETMIKALNEWGQADEADFSTVTREFRVWWD